MNVVAATAMCQPAPVPVLSVTVNCSSAVLVSTRAWSMPLSVLAQLSDVGVVRLSTPIGVTVTVVLGGEGPSVVLVTTVTV